MRANERSRVILETLCERRKDTEVNLAFEFGVSRRTIVNDILELSCHYLFFTGKQLELAERVLPHLQGEDYETMLSMIHSFAPGKRRRKVER